MEQEYSDLISLGLTDGEAKVYLSLLRIGTSTVGPISKKSGVAYSNIYGVLDRLIKKGLASFVIKDKTRYFQPASPVSLKGYLEKYEKEIAMQKASLAKIVPRIAALQRQLPSQEVEVFLGRKGLRSAYEKLTSKGENYSFFYIHDDKYGEEADRFYLNLIPLFKQMGIKARGISNEGEGRASVATIQTKKQRIISYRFVDFPIPGNMDFYGDKMLMISWEHPVVGILITSKSIVENMRKYFESAWKKGAP